MPILVRFPCGMLREVASTTHVIQRRDETAPGGWAEPLREERPAGDDPEWAYMRARGAWLSGWDLACRDWRGLHALH